MDTVVSRRRRCCLCIFSDEEIELNTGWREEVRISVPGDAPTKTDSGILIPAGPEIPSGGRQPWAETTWGAEEGRREAWESLCFICY